MPRRPEIPEPSLQRPTRPTLTRDYILRSALALIDREGLDALTMRRLGAELGTDPTAVYHYVPNKAALLDGVAEILWLDGLEIDGLDSRLGWRELLEGAMLAFRAHLLEHPRAAILAATHPWVTAAQFEFLERALQGLREGGLSVEPETLSLLNVLGTFTLGHVVAEVGEPAGGAGGEFDVATVAAAAAKYPLVAAVLGDLVSGAGDTGDDPGARAERQYRAGLRAILAGWSQ